MVRASSVLSQADSVEILAKTNKFKAGGTFLYTADPEAIQILPEKK